MLVARVSFYRHRPLLGPALSVSLLVAAARPLPARALGLDERESVRVLLNSERFQDCSPAAINATLLDEGQYLCSTRTMYRVLEEDGGTRERRDQLVHPPYRKPELLATAPNQLWSWDITKLRGAVKWNYFYLYVILDVFSRYVVGWMVAPRESAELARKLIEETCEKQNIQPGQLGLHADRGSAMRSKPVALLLADLSVTKTHSRPYTSNDNPYSESQFRADQMIVMQETAHMKYIDNLANHIQARFPSEANSRGLTGTALRAALREALFDAQRYGITDAADLELYGDCAVLLGPGFDRNVSYEWAGAILRREDFTGRDKMNAINEHLLFGL